MACETTGLPGGFEEIFLEENLNIKEEEVTHEFLSDTCDNEIPCEDVLADDKKVGTRERAFKYDLFPKSSASTSAPALQKKNHKISQIRKETSTCDVCQKNFIYPNRLLRHKIIHTGEKPYQCEKCDKCFNTSSYLANHKKTVHRGEKSYQCDQCDKFFSSHRNLTNHKRTHAGEEPYRCDQCDKCFCGLSGLIDHKRVHSGEKPYQCDECDKYFRKPYDLRVHKRTHTGEKPYLCDQCNKSFISCGSLNRHRRKHTGEKPYQCNQCNNCYSSLSALTVHQRIHIRQKPCQCDECDNCSSGLSGLGAGEGVHSGEKSYLCEKCDNSFISLEELAIHNNIHTEEGPHQFDPCPQLSIYPDGLRIHAVHKQDETEEGELDFGSLFVCMLCEEEFKTKQEMRNHATLHWDWCKCEFLESELQNICVSKPSKCTKCEKFLFSESPYKVVSQANEGPSTDLMRPLQNSDEAIDLTSYNFQEMPSEVKAADTVLEAVDSILQKVEKQELDYDENGSVFTLNL